MDKTVVHCAPVEVYFTDGGDMAEMHLPPDPDPSILIVNLINHVQWIRNKDNSLQFEAANEVNLA
jgi:hypothetical protein